MALDLPICGGAAWHRAERVNQRVFMFDGLTDWPMRAVEVDMMLMDLPTTPFCMHQGWHCNKWTLTHTHVRTYSPLSPKSLELAFSSRAFNVFSARKHFENRQFRMFHTVSEALMINLIALVIFLCTPLGTVSASVHATCRMYVEIKKVRLYDLPLPSLHIFSFLFKVNCVKFGLIFNFYVGKSFTYSP